MSGVYVLHGLNPSPYSVKMRAIMRYRRLPHDWILNTKEVQERTRHVKPQIIPKVHFPEEPADVWHVDSSPMAYLLEERHKERSILPDDPGHAIWKRDFTGSSGLFSFVLKGDRDKAAKFVDTLELFGIGYSWGGFESLAVPKRPEKYRSAVPWACDGTVIRLQIGLEDVGDLKADLERGFAALATA